MKPYLICLNKLLLITCGAVKIMEDMAIMLKLNVREYRSFYMMVDVCDHVSSDNYTSKPVYHIKRNQDVNVII